MDNSKLIKSVVKYLSENIKIGSVLGGLKFKAIDKEDIGGFFFDFDGKEYKIKFKDKMEDFPEKSFIRVLDFEREKSSLVQYTIDSSNFISNGASFKLLQNRGATIGRKVVGVEAQFNEIMHSEGFSEENIITENKLKNANYEIVLNDIFRWLRIRIKTKLLLEQRYRDIENETELDILDIKTKTEGGKLVIISIKAERDSSLRRAAIKIHGSVCKVCGFDFNRNYGLWANNYIEVHHMKLISKSKETTIITNPLIDLTVVCANCHRMIHKKSDVVLTVDELKLKLRKQ